MDPHDGRKSSGRGLPETSSAIYHVGDVDTGSVTASDDTQSQSSSRFLHQFDIDEIEHDVVFFGAGLVSENGHFNLSNDREVMIQCVSMTYYVQVELT